MSVRTIEGGKYGGPFILIVSYIILDYGRPFDFVPFLQVFRLPFLVSFLLFLSWLKTKERPSNPQIICLILLLFIMAKTVPFATNNYSAFWGTVDMARLIFFVCLPIIAFVDSFAKIEIFLRVWIASHVFLATYGLVVLGGTPGKMFGAHLGDENDFALAITLAIPYAYFLFLAANSKIQKLFYLSSVVLFIFANIASFSRGGFVALVSVLLYCWLKTPGKFKATIIAGLLVSGMLLFAGEEYWEEIESIADPEQESAMDRRYLWDKAWQMFLDAPLMGVGVQNFAYNVEKYESIERSFEIGVRLSWGRVVHSLYFTLLPELGIPGVLLFCMLLYYNRKDLRDIVNSIKTRNKIMDTFNRTKSISKLPDELRKTYFIALSMNASLIAYLIAGIFLSVLYYPHFWLLIAFACALKNIFDSKIQKSMQEEESAKGQKAINIPINLQKAFINTPGFKER